MLESAAATDSMNIAESLLKSDRNLRLQSSENHLGIDLWRAVASNCNIPSTWWRATTPCIQQSPPRPQYHNSPSLICPSWLCIFILLCFLSLKDFFRLFSDLKSIVVRAPGAEQTAIPPFCSDIQKREGWAARKRKTGERKDCVSVSSLCFLCAEMQICFLTKTLKCSFEKNKTKKQKKPSNFI